MERCREKKQKLGTSPANGIDGSCVARELSPQSATLHVCPSSELDDQYRGWRSQRVLHLSFRRDSY